MKRFIITFIMVFALLLGMTGCTNNNSQTNSGNSQNAKAQTSRQTENTYPKKPIQIIVPTGAGGDTDTYVRLAGKYISKYLGQNFVVVNMEGGGGTVGTKKVLDASPDGYTVLFFHPSMILNEVTGVANYGLKDFEQGPVLVVDKSNTFVVKADSQFKTLKDLIDYAKANPDKVKYGTEMGGFTYTQGLAFEKEAGVKLKVVDVGGSSAKNAALEGKQVDVIPTPVGIVKGFVDSGDFRVLGVMSDSRLDVLPDVPTFKEQGVNLVMEKPYFFMFPKGTPKDVIDKFSAAVEKVTQDSDFTNDLSKYLIKPSYMSPAVAIPYLQNIQKFYEDLYKNAGK